MLIAISTTPFFTDVPTSKVGIAFGPPMKLIWAMPLPSALNFWIQGVMCFTYVVVSPNAETSLSVVSWACAANGSAATATATSNVFLITPL